MEIDQDLAPFLQPDTFAPGEFFIVIDVAGDLPTVDQVRRAIRLGAKVIVETSRREVEFDFGYFEPVTPELVHLTIDDNSISFLNLDVLEGATDLKSVRWLYPNSDTSLDLSKLPKLEVFWAHFVEGFFSVLENPNLQSLSFFGSGVRCLPPIEAPLKKLHVAELRSLGRLPELKFPESLREFRLDVPKEFDAESLLLAPNLESLNLGIVGQLKNLASIGALSNLQRLYLEARSEEDWDLLLDSSASYAELDLRPNPSRRLREEGTARGWTLTPDRKEPASKIAPFEIQEPWDEISGAVLHLDDFDALTELIVSTLGEASLDLEVVNGHMAEDLVRAAIAGDTSLARAKVQFDSESAAMSAAFPNKALATRAAKAALELIRKPDKLNSVLQISR